MKSFNDYLENLMGGKPAFHDYSRSARNASPVGSNSKDYNLGAVHAQIIGHSLLLDTHDWGVNINITPQQKDEILASLGQPSMPSTSG